MAKMPEWIAVNEADEKTENRTDDPPSYQVLLLNDDYTTMDFVVMVLEKIFRRNPVEATQIMLNVHKNGRGLAGTYPREIAETKIESVHRLSRDNGFPLRCVMEKQ